MSESGGQRDAGAWDVYWRGTRENAAHREGGPQEQVLAKFWGELFQRRLAGREPQRLLDLACGNGAVTGYALRAAPEVDSTCADYSRSALLELGARYPHSRRVVADALHPPFASGAFDLVASQFGVEYAGEHALQAAGQLVARDGLLAMVLHLHAGGIYRECEHNLKAVQAIAGLDIMSLARQAFSAGFALNRGSGRVEEFKSAERRFAPAVRGLEGVLRDFGGDAADGLPRQLYQDIAHMYQRMSAYDEADILGWIDGMDGELQAYAGRMSSMLGAALGEESLDRAVSGLLDSGLRPLSRQVLRMGPRAEPAAWAVVLERA